MVIKLRGQLFIGFISITLLILVFGTHGIFSLNRMYQLTEKMYDGPLMSINFARSAQYDFLQIERTFVRFLQETDPDRRAELVQEIAEFRESFDVDIGIAAERLSGADGLAAVTRIREAVADWDDGWQAILMASVESDAALSTNLRERMSAAIDTINHEIEVLVEYAAQEGYDFREAAFDEKTGVIRINVALVVVGVAGGILLAWLMGWRIVNPTVRITNTLRELTIGKSDLDIPETGRRDEIGDIARAAAKFREATEQLREKTEFLHLTELITRAANEATNVDEAVQIALYQVCARTGWLVGHAYMLDEAAGDLAPSSIWHLDDAEQFETFRSVTEATRFASGVGLPGRVLASGQPAWIIDVTQDPNFPRARLAQDIGVKAGFAFPILMGKEVAGIMEFFSAEAEEPRNEMLEIMGHIGTHLGRIIEKKRAEEKMELSREKLRNLYHRLEMVREEERTRIAREFHDELAQVLTTLKMELSLLHKKLGDNQPALQKNTHLMLDVIDATIPAVKQLILDLRPPVLDNLGLQEAIRWQGKEFENRMRINCEFDLTEQELSLDPARSTTLFRIFQETLVNVARHAQAKKVLVKLSSKNNIVTLRVQDDGVGIQPDQISDSHSLGILGIQERVRVWGGSVEFEGSPQKGTTVSVQIKRS